MKVNVLGRGGIPGIGILPVYGVELNQQGIQRLLNFKNARVFNAETNLIITKENINSLFVKKPETPAPENVEEPVVEAPAPVKEEYVAPAVEVVPEVVEEPVVEEAVETEAEPEVEETVEEVTETVEETVAEEVVDEVATEEEAPAEETEEEKPEGSPYKRRNRRKK